MILRCHSCSCVLKRGRLWSPISLSLLEQLLNAGRYAVLGAACTFSTVKLLNTGVPVVFQLVYWHRLISQVKNELITWQFPSGSHLRYKGFMRDRCCGWTKMTLSCNVCQTLRADVCRSHGRWAVDNHINSQQHPTTDIPPHCHSRVVWLKCHSDGNCRNTGAVSKEHLWQAKTHLQY